MGKAQKAGLAFEVGQNRNNTELYGVDRTSSPLKLTNFTGVPTPASKNPKLPLAISGGCLAGPMGHTQVIATIASGAINIGITTQKYGGYIVVQAETGTTDDLTDIDDAQFIGQEAFIQADSTDTITVKTTGNIDTFDGSDLTLSANKMAHFIWDGTKWRQAGGGGGSGITFPITVTVNDHEDTWTSPVDIDLSASDAHVHKFTLDGDLTITLSKIPSDETQIEFEMEFLQDGTGGHTVTFPSEVVETVSVDETADALTIITFRVNDGANVHAITTVAGTIGAATGGGSQTPIIADVDYDGFDIKDLSNLEFRTPTTASPAGSTPSLWVDASGDLVINVATGDQIFLAENNSTIVRLNASGFDMNSKDLVDVSNIKFDNAGNANNTLAHIFSDASGDMVFNVADLDKFFFTINGVTFGLFEDGAYTFKSSFASGTTASTLHIYSNDPVPSDNDAVGVIKFDGNDVALTQVTYAAITASADDITTGTLDGDFEIEVVINNTLAPILDFQGADQILRLSTNALGFKPNQDDAKTLGATTEAWSNTYSHIYTMGTTTTQTIKGDSSGMIFDVPSGDDFTMINDSAAPTLNLQNGAASPSATDPAGNLQFEAENSANAMTNYVRLEGISQNITSSSEEGRFKIYMQKAGAEQEFFRIEGGGNFWFTADDANCDIEFISDRSLTGAFSTIKASTDNASGTQVEMARVSFNMSDNSAGAEIGGINFSVQSPSGGLANAFEIEGVGNAESKIAFFNHALAAQQTVSGARDDLEAALANLLTALDAYGIIVDSTTAS